MSSPIVVEKNSENISHDAIIRMARQAGIVRLAGETYPAIREIIASEIRFLAVKSVFFMEEGQRKTIKENDARSAVKDSMCFNLPSEIPEKVCKKFQDSSPKPAKGKKKQRSAPGVKAAEEIAFYTNQTDFMTSVGPFNRLSRSIIVEINDECKISAKAFGVIQMATEMFIVKFFKFCNVVSTKNKRTTVQLKDVEVVRLVQDRDSEDEKDEEDSDTEDEDSKDSDEEEDSKDSDDEEEEKPKAVVKKKAAVVKKKKAVVVKKKKAAAVKKTRKAKKTDIIPDDDLLFDDSDDDDNDSDDDMFSDDE